MSPTASKSGILRFDRFRLDLRSGELYKSERKIKLQAQPFQVLSILLEHPGEIVTREELRKRLWPADTFVDFDHSLNTAVKKLRQALGEDPKKPRFVETLAKRGYRFVGTVEGIDALPAPAAPVPPSWTGRTAKLRAQENLEFVFLPVDTDTLQEREKLDAANDDVGLSLLIASQRILMVPVGIQVRVLEAQSGHHWQVRILDGEHYGKLALAPQNNLMIDG